MDLKIEDVAAQRSFVFLWCGAYEGLDLGREVSKCLGYNRISYKSSHDVIHLFQLLLAKSECITVRGTTANVLN